MKRTVWLLALACALSGCSTKPQLTPEEKRTLELKPAVVFVATTVKIDADLRGRPFHLKNPYLGVTGSGFLFRHDGYLITNAHVVQMARINDPQSKAQLEEQLKKQVYPEVFDAYDEYLKSKGQPPLTDEQRVEIVASKAVGIRYTPSLTVVLANGTQLPGELTPNFSPAVGVGKDVAIVKVDGTNFPTVPLGDSSKVREQDPIVVIGYPGAASAWGSMPLVSSKSALVPTVTSGRISAKKTLAATNSPVLQSDAAITHGNSGGPAMDANGEVIGIATFGAQETQGFNFFVPINTAWEFVRREGVAPDSGPFTQHWNKALDLYDNKKCRLAVSELDDVLQFMPGLPDALQLRTRAVECADRENPLEKLSDSNAGPWLLYGLAGIAILAVAALAMRLRSAPAKVGGAPDGRLAGTRVEGSTTPLGLPAGRSYGSIQATAGALSGKTFKITKDGLLIGRSSKCQVVLQDDTISHEHAWIVPTGNEVVVIDRGSANGTYLNSVDSPKVSKVGLRNGDRIYLGKQGAAVFTYFNS